jgi:hypothetical protein
MTLNMKAAIQHLSRVAFNHGVDNLVNLKNKRTAQSQLVSEGTPEFEHALESCR